MLKPLTVKDAEAKPDEDQRHQNRLRDLQANIFHLARQYAPGDVLVIMQLAVKEALLALGPLPPYVQTAHHNNVAGRDEWKHVRAAVIVGRTQPSPAAVERIAEALTGQAVTNPLPEDEWYHRVDAVRELVDGSSLLDETDRHPDPLCEAIRWQICEGQIYQGIGRTRGVWRTAETPCDVWVLTDVVLPLPIDGLIHAEWLKPSINDEMIAEGGVVFENAEHAKAAYSDRWKSGAAVRTAKWRAKGGTNLARCVTEPYYILCIGKRDTPCHECPTLRRVDYLRDGAGNDQAVAWFDPALCPDVAAFLTAKLGSLAWLRVEDVPTVEPIKPIVTAAVTPLPATLPYPAMFMMEAGGVVLITPRDAVDVYGSLWKTGDAARKVFQRAGMGATFVPERLCRVDYRREGRGQQPAVAWFDPARDPDEVKAFLVSKLGSLARWDVAIVSQPAPEPPASPEPAPPASPDPAPSDPAPRDPAPTGDALALRPEVSAYAAPDGHTLLAKCPFCDQPHRHPRGGFGPRNAHCANPAGRIYVLRDAGSVPNSILALSIRENNASVAE